MSNLSAVLKELRKQRDQITSNLKRVDEAIAVMSTLDGRPVRKHGTRNMSAAARARIAAAQKARWAKWKRQQKSA